MTTLDSLVERLPRTTLVVGKGGVGKTTCATALAAAFARRGERTLLISTDPAAALGAVVGASLDDTPREIPDHPGLIARQLSAANLRRDFLERWRDTIAQIVDRGTYLDREDIDGLVDAALPGADEIFALLALSDLLARADEYQRVVVDTAPTGHTLRLLSLPETFSALVSLLDAMQDKHRFMVRALTHRYRRDRADEFIEEMRERVDALRAALGDPRSVTAIVVTRAEPVVVSETERYVHALRDSHIAIVALVINAASESGYSALSHVAPDVPHLVLPRLDTPPCGVSDVLALLDQLTPVSPTPVSRPVAAGPHARRSAGPHARTPALLSRTLTIVGGKGGVGKSTVATALSIALADEGLGPVLLVSTDPAPSIADALGQTDAPWTHGDVEHSPPEVAGLTVRQMDAAAAFARLRDTYQSRIDALFDSLIAKGVDAAQDRAILRDLLALAPPGIDEMYALSVLGDALHEGRFARIVVDPAPTGHLLRLLEMPAIALDWSHRLMRLMLKYREVAGLGDAAQELLDFARRTRALDTLLHDHTSAGVVIVSLDEPVVRGETERLLAAIRALGIEVTGVLWNRVRTRPTPLPATPPAPQFQAEAEAAPPVGLDALRRFVAAWRALPLHT